MENKYYPATFDDCIHLMEYEMCNWFYKGVNGEDIFTWKDNPERETYPIWTPLILNLEDNTTFVDHRTSFNRFCFHVGNSTARVKYLDKEDIESFQIPLDEWFTSKHKYQGVYRVEAQGLQINPRVTIKTKDFIRDGSGNYVETIKVYRLNIKNKTEFGKILKQSNIL